MKKMKDYPKVEVSVKDAIALKCGECTCFDWPCVIECPSYLCPLHSARPKSRKDALKSKFWDDDKLEMIARPIIKKRASRTMTEEEKIAAGERLRKMHKNRKREV